MQYVKTETLMRIQVQVSVGFVQHCPKSGNINQVITDPQAGREREQNIPRSSAKDLGSTENECILRKKWR